jgi:hypothetical protein
MVQTLVPATQPSPETALPCETALLHDMEQLRARMLEMSRRLQEMQEMQQGNRNDEPDL